MSVCAESHYRRQYTVEHPSRHQPHPGPTMLHAENGKVRSGQFGIIVLHVTDHIMKQF